MPDDVKRREMSIQDAMEQNAEFFGFDLCDRIRINDSEVLEIPYRELLDVEARKRVDTVYADYERCERITLEAVDGDGKKTTIEGQYKEPRFKDGKPFDLDELVSVALWGEDAYKRFVAVGGPPGLVLMTWSRMRTQIQRRMNAEPKSF